jgi:hypothetical protein
MEHLLLQVLIYPPFLVNDKLLDLVSQAFNFSTVFLTTLLSQPPFPLELSC